MKIWFLLITLLLLPTTSHALTLKEGITKCKAMSVTERKNSRLCQQVIAKIREIKSKKNQEDSGRLTPVSSQLPTKSKNELQYEKLSNIKDKCQKLSPPNQYKYKVCHQFMNQDNDPYLGQEKEVKAQYSFAVGYGLLGNVNGLDVELERRTNYWGIGLFYSQQDIKDLNSNEVSGSAYGASFHYHFTPLYFTQRGHSDFSGFAQVGLTQYTSSSQGQLPNYFYFNVGLDASVPLFKMGNSTVRGFGKLGIVNIYHSESDFLSLGGSGVLGLKFDF